MSECENNRSLRGACAQHRRRGNPLHVSLLLLIFSLVACSTARNPTWDDAREAFRLIDQGTEHLQSGDLEQAGSAFEVAYELAELPAAVDGLGCVSFLTGDATLAEQYFLKAYEMDRDYTHSLGNLALLYESKGYLSDAAVAYSRALEENPKNFKFRNNFAGFLIDYRKEEGSTRQEARRELLKAKALADHPLIAENLERFK